MKTADMRDLAKRYCQDIRNGWQRVRSDGVTGRQVYKVLTSAFPWYVKVATEAVDVVAENGKDLREREMKSYPLEPEPEPVFPERKLSVTIHK